MSEPTPSQLRTDVAVARAHMWREPEFNACGVKYGEAAFYHSLNRLLAFVESHIGAPNAGQDTAQEEP